MALESDQFPHFRILGLSRLKLSKVDRITPGAGPRGALEVVDTWDPWTSECDVPAPHSTFRAKTAKSRRQFHLRGGA